MHYPQKAEMKGRNVENTTESGYGEMIYMEPSGNQMMSPVTEGRQTMGGVTATRSPGMIMGRSIVATVKNALSERSDTAQLVNQKPITTLQLDVPFRGSSDDSSKRSPKTINIGDSEDQTEYNIKTLNARRSPKTVMYQTYTNVPEGSLGPDQPLDQQIQYGSFLQGGQETSTYQIQNDSNVMVTTMGGQIKGGYPTMLSQQTNKEGQYVMNPREGLSGTLTGTLGMNKMSPNKNVDEINSSGEKGYDSQSQLNNLKTALGKNVAVHNVGDSMIPTAQYRSEINQIGEILGARANPMKETYSENEVKRLMKTITRVYDPTKTKEGSLISESQTIVPGASDTVFNDRYRVLQKMNKLSSILLAKRSGSNELNRSTNMSHSVDEPSRKTFDRQTLSRHNLNESKLSIRRSPEQRFLYVSLAMLSSKGPSCEDRTILRRMRLDKGGVVDLAQEENKKKGKYAVRKINRKAKAGGNRDMRPNPKFREKAAKIVQHWWRELKGRMQKVLKKIILIQSFFRGRFVRKYMYDLLYLSLMYQGFCQNIQKVLSSHVRPIVFEKLMEGRKRLLDQLRRCILKDEKFKIIRLKPFWDKWKRYVINYRNRFERTRKVLDIRARNDNNLMNLYKAFSKWKYVNQMIKYSDQGDKELQQKRKFFGLVTLIQGSNKSAKRNGLRTIKPHLLHYLDDQLRQKATKKILHSRPKLSRILLRSYFNKWKNQTHKLEMKNMRDKIFDKLIENHGSNMKLKFLRRAFQKWHRSLPKNTDINFYNGALLLQKAVWRQTYKNPFEALKQKEESSNLQDNIMRLLGVKSRYIKNHWREYFYKWRRNAQKLKDSEIKNKVYFTLLDTMLQKRKNRILGNRFNHWRKVPKTDIKEVFERFKKMVDFVNLLKDKSLQPARKEFLSRAKRYKSSKAYDKAIKTFLERYIVGNKNWMRYVLYNWRLKCKDKELYDLKMKLLKAVCGINIDKLKKIELARYFHNWRENANTNKILKSKRETEDKLKELNKKQVAILMRNIRKHIEDNDTKNLLRIYFTLWKDAVNKKKIEEINRKYGATILRNLRKHIDDKDTKNLLRIYFTLWKDAANKKKIEEINRKYGATILRNIRKHIDDKDTKNLLRIYFSLWKDAVNKKKIEEINKKYGATILRNIRKHIDDKDTKNLLRIYFSLWKDAVNKKKIEEINKKYGATILRNIRKHIDDKDTNNLLRIYFSIWKDAANKKHIEQINKKYGATILRNIRKHIDDKDTNNLLRIYFTIWKDAANKKHIEQINKKYGATILRNIRKHIDDKDTKNLLRIYFSIWKDAANKKHIEQINKKFGATILRNIRKHIDDKDTNNLLRIYFSLWKDAANKKHIEQINKKYGATILRNIRKHIDDKDTNNLLRIYFTIWKDAANKKHIEQINKKYGATILRNIRKHIDRNDTKNLLRIYFTLWKDAANKKKIEEINRKYGATILRNIKKHIDFKDTQNLLRVYFTLWKDAANKKHIEQINKKFGATILRNIRKHIDNNDTKNLLRVYFSIWKDAANKKQIEEINRKYGATILRNIRKHIDRNDTKNLLRVYFTLWKDAANKKHIEQINRKYGATILRNIKKHIDRSDTKNLLRVYFTLWKDAANKKQIEQINKKYGATILRIIRKHIDDKDTNNLLRIYFSIWKDVANKKKIEEINRKYGATILRNIKKHIDRNDTKNLLRVYFTLWKDAANKKHIEQINRKYGATILRNIRKHIDRNDTKNLLRVYFTLWKDAANKKQIEQINKKYGATILRIIRKHIDDKDTNNLLRIYFSLWKDAANKKKIQEINRKYGATILRNIRKHIDDKDTKNLLRIYFSLWKDAANKKKIQEINKKFGATILRNIRKHIDDKDTNNLLRVYFTLWKDAANRKHIEQINKKYGATILRNIRKHIDRNDTKNLLRVYFTLWKDAANKKQIEQINKKYGATILRNIRKHIDDKDTNNLLRIYFTLWKDAANKKQIEQINKKYGATILRNIRKHIDRNDTKNLLRVYFTIWKDAANKKHIEEINKKYGATILRIIRKHIDGKDTKNLLRIYFSLWKDAANKKKLEEINRKFGATILRNIRKHIDDKDTNNLLRIYFTLWKDVANKKKLEEINKKFGATILRNIRKHIDDKDTNNLLRIYFSIWKKVKDQLKKDNDENINKGSNILKSLSKKKTIPHAIKKIDKKAKAIHKKRVFKSIPPIRERRNKYLIIHYFLKWKLNAKVFKNIEDTRQARSKFLHRLFKSNEKLSLIRAWLTWKSNTQKPTNNFPIILGSQQLRRAIIRKPFEKFIKKASLLNLKARKGMTLQQALLRGSKGEAKIIAIRNILFRPYFEKWKQISKKEQADELRTSIFKKIVMPNIRKGSTLLKRHYFNRWKEALTDNLKKQLYMKMMTMTYSNGTKLGLVKYFNIWKQKYLDYLRLLNDAGKAATKLRQSATKVILDKFRRAILSQDKFDKVKQILTSSLRKNDRENLGYCFKKWRKYNRNIKINSIKSKVIRSIARSQDKKSIEYLLNQLRNALLHWRIKCSPNNTLEIIKNIRLGGEKLNDKLRSIFNRDIFDSINRKAKSVGGRKLLYSIVNKISPKLQSLLLRNAFEKWRERLDDTKNLKRRLLRLFNNYFDHIHDKVYTEPTKELIDALKAIIEFRKEKSRSIADFVRGLLIIKQQLDKMKRSVLMKKLFMSIGVYRRRKMRNCLIKWLRRARLIDANKNATIIQKFIRDKLGETEKKRERFDQASTILNRLFKKKALDKIDGDAKTKSLRGALLRKLRGQDMLNKKTLHDFFNRWKSILPELRKRDAILKIQSGIRGYNSRRKADNYKQIKDKLQTITLKCFGKYLDKRLVALRQWSTINRRLGCDKNARVIQRFCKSKMRKKMSDEANDKLRDLFIKKYLKNVINSLRSANKLKSNRSGKLYNTLENIYIRRPFNKLTNAMKWIGRVKLLKIITPKVKEGLRQHYLPFYFMKWKDKTIGDRNRKLIKLQNWIKGRLSLLRQKAALRKKQLLSKYLTKLTNDKDLLLRIPFKQWKRLASYGKLSDQAGVVQRLWRGWTSRKNTERLFAKRKVKDLVGKKVISDLVDAMTDSHNKFIAPLKKAIKTTNSEFAKRYAANNLVDFANDELRNWYLLKLSGNSVYINARGVAKQYFDRWKNNLEKMSKYALRIQRSFRGLSGRNRYLRLVKIKEKIYHLFVDYCSDKKLNLLCALLRWQMRNRMMKCNESSIVIQDWVEPKLRKLQHLKFKKYFHDRKKKIVFKRLSNLGKFRNLYDTILKVYAKQLFKTIVKDDQNLRFKKRMEKIFLYLDKEKFLRRGFQDFRNKIRDMKKKENEAAQRIATTFRSHKVKQRVNRLKRRQGLIDKIFEQLCTDKDNKLKVAFYVWSKKARALECDENARIIQRFTRGILRKLQKKKDTEKIRNVSKLIEAINRVRLPLRNGFNKFRDQARLSALKDAMNKVNDKRKDNLKEAFNAIKRVKFDQLPTKLKNMIARKYKKNDDIVGQYFNIWKNLVHKSNLLKAGKLIDRFLQKKLKDAKVKRNWKKLADLLNLHNGNYAALRLLKRLKLLKGLEKLENLSKKKIVKEGFDQFKDNLREKQATTLLKLIFNNFDKRKEITTLLSYFKRWADLAKKRQQQKEGIKLLEPILRKRIVKQGSKVIHDALLIKTLFDILPKLRAKDFFNRLRKLKEKTEKYKQVVDTLKQTKDNVQEVGKTNFMNKIYKVYIYVILDKMINKFNKKALKTKGKVQTDLFDKLKIIQRMKSNFNYNNKRSCEGQCPSKKLTFRARSVNPKQNFGKPENKDTSKILIPFLAEYLDKKFKSKKQYAMDKMKENDRAGRFCKLYKVNTNKNLIPHKKNLYERMKERSVYIDTRGGKILRLFLLLRKYFIRQTCDTLKDPSRIYRLLYLIKLSMMHKNIARQRFGRELIRKWRFMSFVKKMARRKLELMYKSLHLSYLQMANEVFGEDETNNPSVIKEFERFGNGIGMFVNEDPSAIDETKYCKGVSKKYIFDSVVLEKREEGEYTEKEMETPEKYKTSSERSSARDSGKKSDKKEEKGFKKRKK